MQEVDSDWAMFSDEGNEAVRVELQLVLARLTKLDDQDLNPDGAADLVERIQDAVAEDGHAEVYDTVVREDLTAFIEDAIDAERTRRGLADDEAGQEVSYREVESGPKVAELPPSGSECTVALYSNAEDAFVRAKTRAGREYARLKYVILDGDYAGRYCSLMFYLDANPMLLSIYEAISGEKADPSDGSFSFTEVMKALYQEELRVFVGPETVNDPDGGERLRTGYVAVEQVLGLAKARRRRASA